MTSRLGKIVSIVSLSFWSLMLGFDLALAKYALSGVPLSLVGVLLFLYFVITENEINK